MRRSAERWVHGDLHPANVVVADGIPAGVVGFGALFAGDRAWDLAAAFQQVDPP